MFELTRWVTTLAFAGLVSTAYICFALVFRQMGGEIRWSASYLIAVLLHPLFLGGLALRPVLRQQHLDSIRFIKKRRKKT